MFDVEKIKQLNDLELIVYEYIMAHKEKVSEMTIRQLSENCHVSTSSILRCCSKLGLQGFSELKYTIKKSLEEEEVFSDKQFLETTFQMTSFFKKLNKKSYALVLEPAIQLIFASEHIVFSGIGTSGSLGSYGTRYFMNLGLNAYSIADPFAPVPTRGLENTLAIILSVSGETTQMIIQVEDFKRYGAKILSITNDETSTIAKLADYNLSYYMPEIYGKEQHLNLTTQVPVVMLLELLGQQTSQRIMEEKNKES
ncbi:MAG: MurR/RpiR family transcriptional regulator [Enterococcus sp.]